MEQKAQICTTNKGVENVTQNRPVSVTFVFMTYVTQGRLSCITKRYRLQTRMMVTQNETDTWRMIA